MATEQERKLFKQKVLTAVRERENAANVRLRKLKVTGFMAMEGHLYSRKRKLMVVGRSVNGWKIDGWPHGILPEGLNSEETAERYSRAVLDSVNEGDPCPMTWITDQWGARNGYNTRRSAFWRVIRSVAQKLKIADVKQNSWPAHLVWSNLYKISPAKGGNPGAILCDIQLEGCKKLFALELATYKPLYLLLLTGSDWASLFLRDLGRKPKAVTGFDYVEDFGTLTIATGSQEIRYVVAVHPQTRPEEPWEREVCDAFNG